MWWQPYDINFNTSSSQLHERLKYPSPLYLISCRTDKPPNYVNELTKTRLIEIGALEMMYSYGGWKTSICAALSKAGVEGLLIPAPTSSSDLSWGSYDVSVQFGKQVIYLQTRPQETTLWDFTQIYVIPYGFGGAILNANCLIPDLPQDPYTKKLMLRGDRVPMGECQVLLMPCRFFIRLSSDWSTWPRALQNQVPGEIVWTTGNLDYVVSKYNDSRVQRQFHV